MTTGKEALFPNYGRFPIRLVKGKGSRVWDEAGKEYLDLMSGIAVANLGHAPEPVLEALKRQLDELWHVSNLFEIPGQERLAALLARLSCADLAFFCNSGAEANEAAIKLARRYHRKVLGNNRYEIITFRNSFHGRTLATLTATGQDKVKDGFDPLPTGFVHVDYNDVDGLKSAITDKTAAIMLEFVQGEGGVRPASPDFVAAVKSLCAEHGLLLIADEIQTGIGRTGTFFAYEQFDAEPDIITLAKGLASGFPMGAMLGKAYLSDGFSAGSHGSTFGGTPIACAAALATLETMEKEGIPARAKRLGEQGAERLRSALSGVPGLVEVRGRGLLLGIEMAAPVAGIVTKAQEAGLLVITAGPNVLRLLPALTIEEEQWNRGLDTLAGLIAAESKDGIYA
ncbi:aspartate aminotransferase family protein [Paenibacillus sp.]|uniref:aspartate aminotransferase family protein n=1 Tax=Paenibacillus sp. TaxID=58172 RepID=UPI002D3384AF|nr:aspartate aminotransferase family protein [Paenibacillus sp.]HZG55068.1 aspartate aminotransferase family protein [Paenibacillus sp.]